VTLLVVLAIVGAPAVALRAFCVGPACDEEDTSEASVPFCSLPPETRDLLTAGFREGRSPDALGVTTPDALLRNDDGAGPPWPTAGDGEVPAAVPLALVGEGVVPGSIASARLDDVAPTIEPLLGFRRPFPGVRSGEALAGVVDPDARSPLVVTIVWKHVGASSERAIRRALEGDHPSVVGDAAVGSLPLDPAAVLTTIGTGGLPADHGITGAVIRSDRGGSVAAWSGRAPTSVIAALGDDLDDATDGEALVGLVADERTDRGLIGGTWYLSAGDVDDDDVVIERRNVPVAVEAMISERGYGDGGAADLLGVTLDGTDRAAGAVTRAIVDLVLTEVPGATLVVTATGDPASRSPAMAADDVAVEIDAAIDAPVVAATAAGGLFVDQAVVTDRNISTQRVVDAMLAVRTSTGEPAFADAFPAFAVAFGRYC
jgi:hypothetical protein